MRSRCAAVRYTCTGRADTQLKLRPSRHATIRLLLVTCGYQLVGIVSSHVIHCNAVGLSVPRLEQQAGGSVTADTDRTDVLERTERTSKSCWQSSSDGTWPKVFTIDRGHQ